MQPVGVTSGEALLCTKCSKQASFLSPLGPLCTTDALIGAAFHEWIPTHIRDVAKIDPSGDDTPEPPPRGDLV